MPKSTPKTLIAGNWKMNGRRENLSEIKSVSEGVQATKQGPEVLVCPPAHLLGLAIDAEKDSQLHFGAQDCHAEEDGAYTGDISAEMLADLGAKYVILGHSERRQGHNETDSQVRAKVKAAVRAGLIPIICVGETAGEQTRGRTVARISRQLNGSLPEVLGEARFVIAYEPIWAIGTGLVPTPKQIADVHAMIRGRLSDRFGTNGETTQILYGGSVKPGNAAELLAIENVNGALVGGASLKATDFLGIIQSQVSEVA